MEIVSIDVRNPQRVERIYDLTLHLALAYAYIERLMRSPEPDMAVAMSLTNLQDGIKMLEAAGFQALVVRYLSYYGILPYLPYLLPGLPTNWYPQKPQYEDFYDAFRLLIERIPLAEPSPTGQLPLSSDLLLQAMQDPESKHPSFQNVKMLDLLSHYLIYSLKFHRRLPTPPHLCPNSSGSGPV